MYMSPACSGGDGWVSCAIRNFLGSSQGEQDTKSKIWRDEF